MTTHAEINERNRQFWEQKSQMIEAVPEVALAIAARIMSLEASQQTPLWLLTPYVKAVETGIESLNIVRKDFSRKGGKVSTTDALQEQILVAVADQPDITPGQLEIRLRGELGAGVVTSIDEPCDVVADEPRMIHFVNSDEKPKTASLSGLKDRLARAKKQLLSTTAK